jgi:hypothetical protein
MVISGWWLEVGRQLSVIIRQWGGSLDLIEDRELMAEDYF